MTKYLLVGVDNPYSDRRSDALHPKFPGSTGERLWRMTGLTEAQYVRVFVRDNLFMSHEKSRSVERRRQAARAVIHRLNGRYAIPDIWVVALGKTVAAAFGMSDTQAPLVWAGRTVLVPHPSGLNRWYNDPSNVTRATEFMRRVARSAVRATSRRGRCQ